MTSHTPAAAPAVQRRHAFLDHPGPARLRPPRRRRRGPGELRRRVPAGRRPRLPLPRDRRARHRRRRAARLPRPGAGPGHRPRGPGRGAALPTRCAEARIGGADEIPLLEDLLGAWPEARFNIDVKQAAARSRRSPRPSGGRPPTTGSASARSPTGAWPAPGAALGREVCSALGPRGVAALRAAAATSGSAGCWPGWPAPGVPCAQVPVGLPRPADHRAASWSVRRTPSACRCTPGRSTTPTEMERLLDLGVDGIMTDDISRRSATCSAPAAMWHSRRRTGRHRDRPRHHPAHGDR